MLTSRMSDTEVDTVAQKSDMPWKSMTFMGFPQRARNLVYWYAGCSHRQSSETSSGKGYGRYVRNTAEVR